MNLWTFFNPENRLADRNNLFPYLALLDVDKIILIPP